MARYPRQQERSTTFLKDIAEVEYAGFTLHTSLRFSGTTDEDSTQEGLWVSAPVEKSSSSAGLMSSRPMGGDAVLNSIGVSICGEFFGHGSISTVPGRMNGLHSDPEPLDE